MPALLDGLDFSGRAAVITGAGSGIGAAMAAAFARAGAGVVACDLLPERLEKVVGEIRAAGGKAVSVAGDVTKGADADRFLAAAVEVGGRGGRVDILCNNAGIMDRRMPVDEVDEETWNRVLAVNLTGPYLLCHRSVKLMLAASPPGGVIVNTASVAGLRGGRAGAAYTASKHGLIGLTQNIAATFGMDGIRCNAICPGGVATQIMDAGPPSERGSRLFQYIYRPEATDPVNIANLALFLASDAAAFINGAAVVADGGMLAI
jgi:NAD(P)-dependent dehydrogenase (short-subunit alcohol dehydrogenase family)